MDSSARTFERFFGVTTGTMVFWCISGYLFCNKRFF